MTRARKPKAKGKPKRRSATRRGKRSLGKMLLVLLFIALCVAAAWLMATVPSGPPERAPAARKTATGKATPRDTAGGKAATRESAALKPSPQRRNRQEAADQGAADQSGLEEITRHAEQGDLAAQLELAERYCKGKGVDENKFKCKEWYTRAADQGSGIAMLRIGDMYATGEGFMLDRDAALRWWQKAQATKDGAEGASKRIPPGQPAPGR